MKAKEFAEFTYNAPPPSDVSLQEAVSNTLASLLADVGAIKFGEFTLASGKTSPYYIDLRVIPSFPQEFQKLTDLFTRWLAGHPEITFDRIAGVPTAGISFATAICNHLSLPLLYIRSEPKKHGRQKRVEGVFESGDHVLIIDDLITDGGSKIDAVQALRDVDLKVTDVLVAVDREQGGAKQLKDAKLILHALAPISQLIKSLEAQKRLSESDAKRILAYISNPT